MTQEYVVVEDPNAPRERPTEHGSRRVRRVRIALLVAAVLVFAAMGVALAWPDGDDEADPAPDEESPTANAAKATAVVYQEWLDRNVLVECMAARGFPYEVRIVDHAELLGTATQFLELEPATAHPDAPVPMLRQPDLYLGRGGEAMAERTRGGSACTMPRTAVDIEDDEAVEQAVADARADDAFLETIAEQVWVQQHPAEVTHEISMLRHDRSSGMEESESSRWNEALSVVVDVARDRALWVPVVTESQESFAQTVGLTESGGAVAVRVGSEDRALDRGTYLTRAEVIACGPVTISAGVKIPWGEGEELTELMDALGPACNALIGAGVVEGETLAEVYWD